MLAPHRFFIVGTEEKGKVFESLSLGRVHAFGPDAMLHRVSLETSTEDNKSLEAIYSNSWIQANKKKIGKQSKTLGSSQHDLGHVDPLEVQVIC